MDLAPKVKDIPAVLHPSIPLWNSLTYNTNGYWGIKRNPV